MTFNTSIRRPALRLLPVLLLFGCTGTAVVPDEGGGADARVTGTVSYLQRTALPPGALITVKLVDVSRADAPAIVLGEQQLRAEGRQVPFAFSIAYDRARIDPRLSYAVEARIEDSGRLLFISDQHHAVLTRGAPDRVDLLLRAVGTGP
jgi:putative lipoprotein